MKILNISYAIPSLKVSNQDLLREVMERSRKHLSFADLKKLEKRVKTFFRMSGTDTRYHRNAGERALDFALSAGKKALDATGVDPEDIDLLIYAGVGRGWIEPATANLFQHELGLARATCFDVMDACASWIRSLSIAKSFLDQAAYRMVMILNCEFSFREYAQMEITDLDDLQNSFSAYTIGEAATATILTNDGDQENCRFSFRTWGEKHGLCKIPLPNAADFTPENGHRPITPMSFFTSPAELFAFTINKLIGHFRETLPIAEKDHDLIIGHAVSGSATHRVVRKLGLDPGRVFETHPRFGNTVSASLPLGLAVAESEGRLKRGMRVLLLMGSAGVTTGLGSVEY